MRCPRGHENPPRQQFCGECGSRLVGVTSATSAPPTTHPDLDQQLQQGSVWPPTNSPPPPRATPGSQQRFWIAAISVVTAVVAVVVAVGIVKYHQANTSDELTPSIGGQSSPSQRTALPTGPVAPQDRHPLPDADAQGFVGYAGGRCRDADPAIAMGRTTDSLVVICQHAEEAPYYVGFGLGNGLPIVIPKALRYNDTGFVVTNLDTQYTITPQSLTIYQAATGNAVEPMIEYWPSAGGGPSISTHLPPAAPRPTAETPSPPLNTDWQPCVETNPLVSCSTDSQYPCGSEVRIWECPGEQPSPRFISVGTQFLGSQASQYTSGELSYIGAVVELGAEQQNPFKVNDPDGTIRLGHSVCDKIDALLVSTHAVPHYVDNDAFGWIYKPNQQYLTIPAATLVVRSAINFLCPRYRPSTYGYNMYP